MPLQGGRKSPRRKSKRRSPKGKKSKRNSPRKASPYATFVGRQMKGKNGKTMKQAAAAWRRKKSGRKMSGRVRYCRTKSKSKCKSSKVCRKSKDGKRCVRK